MRNIDLMLVYSEGFQPPRPSISSEGNSFIGIFANKVDRPDSTSIQTQRQIQKLTTEAISHLSHGEVESAFDSLFEAYVLDPMSPFVLVTEKSVLPSLKRIRRDPLSTTKIQTQKA